MISKLAKSQVEKWWSEGLRPTVEDIVRMNDLGLAVERGSDMFSFSACPRLAFLGDTILREPTVAKRMWIDEAQRLFADTVESKIYVLAFALGTPDAGLPDLGDRKRIEQAVTGFRDEVLLKFTDTQIMAAVEYALNGVKPDLELPDGATDAEKKEAEELERIYEPPCADHSVAKQLILQALAAKIPAEAAEYALLEDLERMVLVAAMNAGADVLKNEHTRNAGRFYMAAGRIKARLTEEKEKGKS